MGLLYSFLVGAISCFGLCLLIGVPKKNLIMASFIGGCGWTTYEYMIISGSSPSMSVFLGSCIVAILSDFASKKFKQASTIFVIPGILPLVPGAAMYHTMKNFIDKNYEKAAEYATTALFIAGSIAIALLVTGAIIRTIYSLLRKIK